MCQPPAEKITMAVSKAIGEPDVTIRRLRRIHSFKLHRVYEVVLSDGRTLELVMPPPSMLRLLRSERQIVNLEAVVVQWLSTLLSEESPADPGGFPHDKSDLLRLLPRLVSRSIATVDLGGPYSIYQSRGGTPIASQPRPLTKQQRANVDFQKGRLAGQFSRIKSPTGRFGYAVSVVASNESITRTKDGGQQSQSSSGSIEGSRTWSDAFRLMFEGVLRDSEDMAIMLAYPIIRRHLARLSYVLDEVTVPALAFIDGMDDDNVLVTLSPTKSRGTRGDDDRGHNSWDSNEDSNGEPSRSSEPSIQIVGLRDWSNGVFGDPLLATAFSKDPSNELLEGFYGTTTGKQSPAADSEEQSVSAKMRLLLYQAYHATVSIVTEFYRPRSESTTRELAARRTLTEALMKLEDFEDDLKSIRHRRPSGEMSPAKKLKPDDTETPPSSRR
ncbi:hypothetical protein BR93DRAFT_885345 [Coniochaeta sp. PMI_546]|nr:hypothetical protein BR93DRAFT_885345 [Coniochaeta sp. PMI_546]